MGIWSGRKHGSGSSSAPAPAAPVAPPSTSAQVSAPPGLSSGRAALRESNRQSRASRREIERQRAGLDANEKRVKQELKQLAASGRMGEARVLAKNLIQIRAARQKLFMAETQLGAVQTEMVVANSQGKVLDAVAGATQIMANTNGAGNAQKAMQIAQQFQMETEKASMAQEMTDDALDSAFGGVDVDEESDAVLQSVLDDIGLEVGGKLGAAPSSRPAPQQQQVQAGFNQFKEEDDLIARLTGLDK